MSNETPASEEGNVEGTLNAVAGLVKEIPVYEDALQPLAKEAGKALQTVGRTVNVALLPLRGVVWGLEKVEDFVSTKVTAKLENTPVENICTPDLAVAGPALESLKYSGHKESLSDMYANLLASAMNTETARNAHPGFVEIIRNMSSDEALLFKFILKGDSFPLIDIQMKMPTGGKRVINEFVTTLGFEAECEHQDLVASYLVNLERLGLIEIPKDSFISTEGAYDRIINDSSVQEILNNLNSGNDKNTGDIKKYHTRATVFGRQFGEACVLSRS